MFGPPGVFLFYHFTQMKAQTSQTETSQLGAENPTESKTEVVNFNKTKIPCSIDQDGSIFVGIRPICEAIGMDTKKAVLSMKEDTILKAKVTERYLLDASKRKFPMQCIPIQYLHGWLFSISENKVTAAAKPKLIKFKEECYQVLFDHFYGKYKVYEENLTKRRMLMAQLSVELANKQLIEVKVREIKKQLAQIEEDEITGQLKLIK